MAKKKQEPAILRLIEWGIEQGIIYEDNRDINLANDLIQAVNVFEEDKINLLDFIARLIGLDTSNLDNETTKNTLILCRIIFQRGIEKGITDYDTIPKLDAEHLMQLEANAQEE